MPKLRDGDDAVESSDRPTDGPTITTYLESEMFHRHLGARLPKHLDSERFVSVALSQFNAIPELRRCTPASVLAGMMQSAAMGLEIGIGGECWLLPYWNNKPKDKGEPRLEAQLQVGVWGFLKLAYQSDRVADVQFDVVTKHEKFSFRKGSDHYLHHEPPPDRDLDAIDTFEWVYAVIHTVTHHGRPGLIFECRDMAWVERIRGTSKAPNSPAWMNWYAEQAQAKVLKRALKLAPKSFALAQAIQLDDEADAGVQQTFTVDVSQMLPAEAQMDEATRQARNAMKDLGKQPSREPEPEPVNAKRTDAPPRQASQPAPNEAPPDPKPEAEPEGDGDGMGWD